MNVLPKKMICKLCLEGNDNFIRFTSEEGVSLNVNFILNKYFTFCFEDDTDDGIVCRKCWWKVEMFHEFYIHIENIHSSAHQHENIFVANINDELKIPLLLYDKKDEHRISKPKAIAAGHENLILKIPKRKSRNGDEKSRTDKVLNKSSRTKSASIFECETCKLPFLSKHKLYCHVKKTHLALQFKCIQRKCVESFESQEQLDEHVKQNHARVQCPQCSKMFAPYYLAEHIKLNHDETQRVVCDICGKVSSNMRVHKAHYQLAHVEQQKVQCDICKAWLANKWSIRTHMVVRHIQVPETCSICGRISANKNALVKHKKSHFAETREKYKCIVCNRGFRDNNNLRQHSVVHSGISEIHPCNICNKTFRLARSLRIHRKKVHHEREDEQPEERGNQEL